MWVFFPVQSVTIGCIYAACQYLPKPGLGDYEIKIIAIIFSTLNDLDFQIHFCVIQKIIIKNLNIT